MIAANKIKKILLIGHANIGDAFSNVVVINPLRQHFPDAHIAFLASPQTKDIISAHSNVDEVIILDRKGKDGGFFGRIKLQYKLFRHRFDLVISLNNTWMHRFLGARYGMGVRDSLDCDFKKANMHLIDIYLQFLRSLDIHVNEPNFEFKFTDQENQFCDDFLNKNNFKKEDKLVGILPIAAWSRKNWPEDSWNALSDILVKKHNIRPIALGKSTDDSFSQNFLNNMSSNIISLIDQTSIKEAMALIKRLDLFIGPDSSLLHFASCSNIESIGLYGPTPKNYVYPYKHKHNIIGPYPPDGMICSKDQHTCNCCEHDHPSACMERITIKEVLKLIKDRLYL